MGRATTRRNKTGVGLLFPALGGKRGGPMWMQPVASRENETTGGNRERKFGNGDVGKDLLASAVSLRPRKSILIIEFVVVGARPRII